VLNPIGAKTVNEGQALAFTATGSDPDGNALTFTSATLPSGATLTPAGAFSWTPDFTQAGNYNVTITVSDGALAASETFTISVGNVNRPPVLSPSPVGNRNVTVGQTLTIAITASDPDGDALSFGSANLPSGATLVPGAPGAATFSWTPTAAQTGSFPNVTFTVSDGALTDSEIFTITVAAVAANHPPVVTNPGNKTVTEGQLLSFTITGTDPDGNTLSFFASGSLPSGATLGPSGAFRWTPATGQAGAYSVTVTATDNGTPPLTSAPQTFMITVQAAAPASGSVSINEAEWGDSRLKVEGKAKPGRVTVTIIDAVSGKTLGTALANGEGEWSAKIRLATAPCKVQAKVGAQLSAIVTVKGAPRSCTGGSGHDDDD
jgi:PKD repeat protein